MDLEQIEADLKEAANKMKKLEEQKNEALAQKLKHEADEQSRKDERKEFLNQIEERFSSKFANFQNEMSKKLQNTLKALLTRSKMDSARVTRMERLLLRHRSKRRQHLLPAQIRASGGRHSAASDQKMELKSSSADAEYQAVEIPQFSAEIKVNPIETAEIKADPVLMETKQSSSSLVGKQKSMKPGQKHAISKPACTERNAEVQVVEPSLVVQPATAENIDKDEDIVIVAIIPAIAKKTVPATVEAANNEETVSIVEATEKDVPIVKATNSKKTVPILPQIEESEKRTAVSGIILRNRKRQPVNCPAKQDSSTNETTSTIPIVKKRGRPARVFTPKLETMIKNFKDAAEQLCGNLERNQIDMVLRIDEEMDNEKLSTSLKGRVFRSFAQWIGIDENVFFNKIMERKRELWRTDWESQTQTPKCSETPAKKVSKSNSSAEKRVLELLKQAEVQMNVEQRQDVQKNEIEASKKVGRGRKRHAEEMLGAVYSTYVKGKYEKKRPAATEKVKAVKRDSVGRLLRDMGKIPAVIAAKADQAISSNRMITRTQARMSQWPVKYKRQLRSLIQKECTALLKRKELDSYQMFEAAEKIFHVPELLKIVTPLWLAVAISIALQHNRWEDSVKYDQYMEMDNPDVEEVVPKLGNFGMEMPVDRF